MGKEHAAFTEELAYVLHTSHQGAFDDGYGRGVLGESFLQIGFEGVTASLDEGLLETFLEGYGLRVES